MSKMDEYTSKILIVFFEAMVERANVGLIEKAQDVLLQLAAAFAGDNFDQIDAAVHSFLDNSIEFFLDGISPVVDVVEIEFQLCHSDAFRVME